MKNAQQATSRVNVQGTTVRHKNGKKKVLQMLETKNLALSRPVRQASEGLRLFFWPITDSATVLQFYSTLYRDTWLNESVC